MLLLLLQLLCDFSPREVIEQHHETQADSNHEFEWHAWRCNVRQLLQSLCFLLLQRKLFLSFQQFFAHERLLNFNEQKYERKMIENVSENVFHVGLNIQD